MRACHEIVLAHAVHLFGGAVVEDSNQLVAIGIIPRLKLFKGQGLGLAVQNVETCACAVEISRHMTSVSWKVMVRVIILCLAIVFCSPLLFKIWVLPDTPHYSGGLARVSS